MLFKKVRTSQSLAYVILPRFGAFSSSSSLSVALFFLFPVFPVAPEVLSARDNEAGTEPVGVAACEGVFESGPSCACIVLSVRLSKSDHFRDCSMLTFIHPTEL